MIHRSFAQFFERFQCGLVICRHARWFSADTSEAVKNVRPLVIHTFLSAALGYCEWMKKRIYPSSVLEWMTADYNHISPLVQIPNWNYFETFRLFWLTSRSLLSLTDTERIIYWNHPTDLRLTRTSDLAYYLTTKRLILSLKKFDWECMTIP